MSRKHQNGRAKLNLRSPHRRALLRNQVIHLIKFGCLQSTKARVKSVQSLAEKMVTLARKGGDFNTIRRLRAELPYDFDAVTKLINEIAPRYVTRPGGYTRVISLGIRPSDTAPIARLEWI
jgi:large subunit ribosomal protein L17